MIRRQNALRSTHRRSHRQQATVYTPTGTEAAETARNALTTAPEGTERAGALALDPEEAEDAGEGVYEWLKSVGVGEKLLDEGFVEGDVEKLTDLVFTTPSLEGLINIGPSGNDREMISEIYKESL